MKKVTISLLALLILVGIAATACGGGGDQTPEVEPTPTYMATPIPTNSPENIQSPIPTMVLTPTPTSKSVVITIGNHTDVTGMSSNMLIPTTMALEDLANYYNEHNLIPGVEFDVITYDGQFDPSRDEAGYEWLVENGADLIFTPVPSTAVNLKHRVDEDKLVLLTVALADEAFDPPGWVFAVGNTMGKSHAYTGLNWVAEFDPDFPKDRPAKLGGTFWTGTYSEGVLTAATEYCDAHPDQYEFVGGYLVAPKFKWDEEVEALKDCDFVLPPAPMNQFVQQYREAGHTARFMGTDWHVASLDSISEANLWDEIDGMLFIQPTQWWNDEGEVIELTKTLLHEYHPGDASDIIRSGGGYLKMQQMYIMFEIIADTVESVGAEHFNSQNLYDTMLSFSTTIDGCAHSFSTTKRTSNDNLAAYDARAEDRDIFRRYYGPKWHPILYEP
ncbi:ABC transporter substrate-binding protein [Chloroflexota bacterium]